MNNTKIHKQIESYVSNRFNQLLKERLEKLYEDYPEDIVRRVVYPVSVAVVIKKIKRNMKLNDDQRCQARTGKNKRCSRPIKHSMNDKYCLSHCTTLPYGNIHSQFEFVQKKKRGRKKTKLNVSFSENDAYLYVNSLKTTIDDVDYYVDENRVIFDMS